MIPRVALGLPIGLTAKNACHGISSGPEMGLTLGTYSHMIRYKPGSQHGNAKLPCIPSPNSGPCSLHGLPELLVLDNASVFPVLNARMI